MKQNEAYIIGLTGGISSGKSAVDSHIIREGFPIIDSDQVAREVVEPGSLLLSRIREDFGDDLFYPDGSLNREETAKAVFSDPEKLNRLNELIHPEIYRVILKKKEMLENAGETVIFLDIPLLFEVREGMEEAGITYDEIWVIYVTPENQVTRLMKRDNIDREYALEKIGSQMPLEKKRELADVVIDNNGTFEELEAETKWHLDALRKRTENMSR